MTSFESDADPYGLLSTPIPAADLVASMPSWGHAPPGRRRTGNSPSAVRVGFGVGQTIVTALAALCWVFAALVVLVSMGLPNPT